MRALIIGNDRNSMMNLLSALSAVGAEAHVISDWRLPSFSGYCRDHVRVAGESLDFAADSGRASEFVASYCETYGIDIVIPADVDTSVGMAQLPEGMLPCFPVASPQSLQQLVRASKSVITQRHSRGEEVTLSVLAQHGRIVAHSTPVDTQVLKLAKAVVAAAKLHGAAQLEMRTDTRDGSLYVVDCSACVWGSAMTVRTAAEFIRLGAQMARGTRLPEVESHIATPRRALNALLRGRSTLSFRKQAHRDAWIRVAGEVTQRRDVFMREKLAPSRA